MNKIIKLALTQATPTLEALLEVIAATPNAEVATEILLGIYEDPLIGEPGPEMCNHYHNIEFLSYDKFKQQINFKYIRVEKVTGWVPNTIENPTVDNIVSKKSWADDAFKDNPSGCATMEEFGLKHKRTTFIVKVTDEVEKSYTSITNWHK